MNKKLAYIFTCLLLTTFLFGCREKKNIGYLFEGLPESSFLTEMKTSLENKKPIAVTFTAEWCPHCRKYKPTFFEVKNLFENQVTFLNIDVDDSNGSVISGRFQVKGIPTTAFIRPDGSIFKVQVGGIEKEDLVGVVNALLKSKKKRRGEPIAPFPIEKEEVVQPKSEPPQEPQEIIKKETQEESALEEQKPSSGKPPEEQVQPSEQETPTEEVKPENSSESE